MATAKLYTNVGSYKSDLELAPEVFGVEVSKACIYLTINAFLAAQRQGTASTPNRSGVHGTGAKPWKQKGTGRARSGTNTSGIWVRGHKAHGPKPRDYDKKVNKKVRRKALLSALTVKAEQNAISIFESLQFDAPKTKSLLGLVSTAGLEPRNTLFVASSQDQNLLLCARNIPWARVIRAEDVNTYELIRARNVVFSQAAVDTLKARLFGGEES
jgi:large subunit ribosomal protein L4